MENQTQKLCFSPEDTEKVESSPSSLPRGVTQGRCLPQFALCVCVWLGGWGDRGGEGRSPVSDSLPQTFKGYSARPGRMRGNKQMGLGVTRGPGGAGRGTGQEHAGPGPEALGTEPAPAP